MTEFICESDKKRSLGSSLKSSNVRFAIWAAVSTKAQAKGMEKKEKGVDDKVSLEHQENVCRTAGESRGWIETCKPYIMAHSRSFYVNLFDAERDIPALRSMLEDARSDKFDVLIIFSYDRLGDITDMVAQSLRFYGKQLFSVNQPVEPQEPDSFNPYGADSEAIMRDVARIWQRQRIIDLQRKRASGMPARIKNGLNPARVPFGYRWRGKKEPPEKEQEKAALVVCMKDMFLRGTPVSDIMRYADSTGIKPPNGGEHWQDGSIRAILLNPFYAGFVSIRRYQTVRDPRQGHKARQIKLPRSKWVMGQGKHVPLWDESVHHMISFEMESRHNANIHHRVRYPLAGILFCKCGAKLTRVSHGHGIPRPRVWVCSEGKSAHFVMPYKECEELVFRKIASELGHLKPKKPADTAAYLRAIEELKARKKRVQEGYELGGYDKIEFIQKVNDIDSMIEDYKEKVSKQEQALAALWGFINLPGDKFEGLVAWFHAMDPAELNAILRKFVGQIVVNP